MTNIEKVNQALKSLRIRTKAIEFKGHSHYFNDIEFYKLSNHKMLIVFYEMGIIKSMARQRRINKKYSYQINGQEGTNTELLYYAEFDYEKNRYYNILTA